MRRLRAWFIRVGDIFNQRRRDSELTEELESYLQIHIDDKVRQGLSPEEARRAALMTLGGVEQVKENYRERRSLPLLESTLQDLRYALRLLRKTPAFTAVAVLTLALGIGANTAIFSLVYGIFLKPLPYTQPDRLAAFRVFHRGKGGYGIYASLPDIQDYQKASQTFEAIAGFQYGAVIAKTGDEQTRLVSYQVSPNLFPLLGTAPLLGRTFTEDEAQEGHASVAVLSYKLWQKRFGADPSVVGKSLTVGTATFTIIGVMPRGFAFPQILSADLWMPLRASAYLMDRNQRFTQVIGRLKPGVTLEQAQAEMTGIATGLEQAYPQSNNGWTVALDSLFESDFGGYGASFKLLLGAVAFLLLIACANIASLFLARGQARQKELAVRAALGASRVRLIKQVLTESVVIAFLGGAAGLLLAYWSINFLAALLPSQTPRLNEVTIDSQVLIFTLLASLLTGLLCGLAPALQINKAGPGDTLKDGSQSVLGGRRRLHHTLVTIEIALSLMLLIGAGLMVKTFFKLMNQDRGFNPDHVLTLHLTAPWNKYQDANQRLAVYHQVLERISHLSGVEAVGAVTGYPGSSLGNLGMAQLNASSQKPEDRVMALFVACSPDYFRVMKVPLLSGRFFNDQDNASARKVVLVNQKLAKRLWPNEEPLGKLLTLPNRIQTIPTEAPLEVVGVIGNIRFPASQGSLEFYLPTDQSYAFWQDIVLRTTKDPASYIAPVRQLLREIDNDFLIEDLQPMDRVVSNMFALYRAQSFIVGAFAVLALVLAAVGIYGVLSYFVSQRTREIGIRMALGAKRSQILSMIIGQGMLLTTIGVVIGLGGAYALIRILQTKVFGLSRIDPLTLVETSLLLILVALLACYLPARRATKVDPMVALRYE